MLFNSGNIGPIKLRNRSIRSAAFEGMSENHHVTDELIEYHRKVAAGGIGMTTVAYASVSRDGLSFPHQLWIREEILPGLRKLSNAVHGEGAAISIQIGHTGNMSKKEVMGMRPIAPSGRFNLYGPTWPRKMNQKDIERVVDDFRKSVILIRESGFDAVEIHAGHGYLISQFLSPYTNHRNDEYGGSFENRSKFLRKVLKAVKEETEGKMALLVKMNMSDGFQGGISQIDAIKTAKLIEEEGGDAIVLSGGFVSRAPLYIMRGKIPSRTMSYYIHNPIVKILVRYWGQQLMKPIPFMEGYFMEEAQPFLNELKIPVVAVGGMNSLNTIQKALNSGFEYIAIARALIEDPEFIRKLENNIISKSACNHCNYCVAVMYSGKMRCYMHDQHIPEELKAELPGIPER